MKYRHLFAVLAILSIIATTSSSAQDTPPSGQVVQVSCPVPLVVSMSNDGRSATIQCNPESAPTATPTATSVAAVTPSPTVRPSATAVAPTSTARPTEVSGTFSPYGAYPYCIAPAIPIETHSWWTEGSGVDEVQNARHIHMGICAPNARDTTGQAVSVNGSIKLTMRVMVFNHPGQLDTLTGGFYEGIENQNCGRGDGTAFCYSLRDIPPCQQRPNEHKQCEYYFDVEVDAAQARYNGLRELRIRPSIRNADLGNERQFTTWNSQIYVNDSRNTTTRNYRSSPAPIGRSWYEGLNYANTTLVNYLDLFRGDTSRTIPLLSGTVQLVAAHREASGSVQGLVTLDPHYHAFHEGTRLGRITSNSNQTITLDTRTLANGVHMIFVETIETNANGTQRGQIGLPVEVRN